MKIKRNEKQKSAKGTSCQVFGVPIEAWSWPEIKSQLLSTSRRQSIWIVTANPEILLAARQQPEYAKTLAKATARVVDGFGLWLALALRGMRTTRLTGVELTEQVLSFAEDHGWRVGLLGGGDGIAPVAAQKMKQRFSQLMISAESGGRVEVDGGEDVETSLARQRLQRASLDVLLVAFGHPKQERWIARHQQDFPGLKLIVGIGGVFDYWAGMAKLAPKIIRRLGLEWLWRLCHEPRRFGRIFRATVLFPLAVSIDKERSIR